MDAWDVNDKLPASVVSLIQGAIFENCFRKKEAFIQVAKEWEINPSILSRWMAGFGPLNQEDVIKLARAIGPAIYTALGWVRP